MMRNENISRGNCCENKRLNLQIIINTHYNIHYIHFTVAPPLPMNSSRLLFFLFAASGTQSRKHN